MNPHHVLKFLEYVIYKFGVKPKDWVLNAYFECEGEKISGEDLEASLACRGVISPIAISGNYVAFSGIKSVEWFYDRKIHHAFEHKDGVHTLEWKKYVKMGPRCWSEYFGDFEKILRTLPLMGGNSYELALVMLCAFQYKGVQGVTQELIRNFSGHLNDDQLEVLMKIMIEIYNASPNWINAGAIPKVLASQFASEPINEHEGITQELTTGEIDHAIDRRELASKQFSHDLSLLDCLYDLKVPELKSIAKNRGLSGYSKYVKADLVTVLYHDIVDESAVQWLLLNDEHFETLIALYERPLYDENDQTALELLGFGYCFVYYIGFHKILYVPEEVVDALQDELDQVYMASERNDKAEQAMVFAMMQFGIMSFSDFNAWVSHQEWLKDTPINIAETARMTSIGFDIKEELLFLPSMENDFQAIYQGIQEHAQTYSYCNFSQEAFEQVVSTGDWRITEAQRQFSQQLSDLGIGQESHFAILQDIQIAYIFKYPMQEMSEVLLDRFDKRNSHLSKGLRKAVTHYCTNGELWAYKGHVLKRTSKVIKLDVGRNEACPCGSGKKFKKCCGKV